MRSSILFALAGCSTTPAPMLATPRPVPPAVTDNPCFANQPPIVATEMHTALENYSWSLYFTADEPQPPSHTTYGSCNVDHSKVTTADGRLVAELSCGVRVLSRGIVDELGLQIGARGKDVLDRKPHHQPLTCVANGPDQVRCYFERAENSDTDESWYVVAGSLGDDPLTGDAALAYFASRPLVELVVSMWCH